jgi:hypothetical protein
MKKLIYLLALIAIAFQSCTKDFEEINQNPAQFNAPAPEAIFTGVMKTSVDLMASHNMSYMWSYSHLLSIEGGTSRYNTGDDNTWNRTFINVLSNNRQIINRYKDKPGFNNRVQMSLIWESYMFAYLVGLYGPIPYSDAFKTDLSAIKFDSENDVYIGLMDRLKKSSDALVIGGDSFKPDVLLAGDILKWKKFANSLRLRLALRCQKNLPDVSAAVIKELMGKEDMMLSSSADNVVFNYYSGDVNESPYYTRFIRNPVTLDQIPKLGSVLFMNLRTLKDPRIVPFAEPVPEASRVKVIDTLGSTLRPDSLYVVEYTVPYLGAEKSERVLSSWGLSGNSPFGGINRASYSNMNPSQFAPEHAFYIMDYSEVSFMKAEAKHIHAVGSKTAENYYLDGIADNFKRWNLTDSVAAYTARDGVKWNTAKTGFYNYNGIVKADISSDNLDKIFRQRWISYFPDGGFESWSLQRRTRNLDLPPHLNPGNPFLGTDYADIPDRWEYRDNQINLNPVGHKAAIADFFGGQNLPTKPLGFAKTYVPKNWAAAKANYNIGFVTKWYGTTIEALKASGVTYKLVSTLKK